MALFGLKKNKEIVVEAKEVPAKKRSSKTKAVKAAKTVSVAAPVNSLSGENLAEVLIRPRVTEKATDLSANNVYTFNVQNDASARDVAKAVEIIYKVHPVKVNVMNLPKKKVFIRGRFGSRGGGKKAYVYLSKGEKIEFV